MHLSPKEIDKLLLHNAGFLSQKRLARGIKLNYPESVALIASQTLEWIREGESVAELMDKGKKLLGFSDVMPGVGDLIHEVQVEGTFPDGTKLVTIHQPISSEKGDMNLALYGSGLSYNPVVKSVEESQEHIPGEVQTQDKEISLNEGREVIELEVTNSGDRPIQVGSHYNFFETNPALKFDRKSAFGFRLDIPSGTAIRFEPGDIKKVSLVKISGKQIVHGGNNWTRGSKELEPALERLEKDLP